MSLLFNGSYANPAQSLWLPVSGSGSGGSGSDYPVDDASGNNIGGLTAGDISGNLVTPVGLQARKLAFTLPGVIPNSTSFTYNSYMDISTATAGTNKDYLYIGGSITTNHLQDFGDIAGSAAILAGQSNISIGPISYLTSNSFVYLSHVKRSISDVPIGNLCYNAYDVSSNTMRVYTADASGNPITVSSNMRFNWMIVNNGSSSPPDIPRLY